MAFTCRSHGLHSGSYGGPGSGAQLHLLLNFPGGRWIPRQDPPKDSFHVISSLLVTHHNKTRVLSLNRPKQVALAYDMDEWASIDSIDYTEVRAPVLGLVCLTAIKSPLNHNSTQRQQRRLKLNVDAGWFGASRTGFGLVVGDENGDTQVAPSHYHQHKMEALTAECMSLQ
ncbi:hypothetical protein VNO77_17383 [Canavalia gladiata]|uniref:Uncharacterized protein n=1 Tax=Canavalia gladiata TaxID=3824 RepID=A0AAN9LNQ5_CANGL